jgi:hypothetical protein
MFAILSLLDVSVVGYFVIIATAYPLVKSESPPNCLVTQHGLKDHPRWIVLQGDGDHDLGTNGSFAQVTVMFTST